MDSQRFDELVRRFALAGASRRSLLKAVVGGAASIGLSAVGLRSTLRAVASGGLLAPVDAGISLTVYHGYNDPMEEDGATCAADATGGAGDCTVGECDFYGHCCPIGSSSDHCGHQKYGLDLRPSGRWDGTVLAPVSGQIWWNDHDRAGNPFFPFCLGLKPDDDPTKNLTICHLDNGQLVSPGMHVNQGQCLGKTTKSWIHLNLDDGKVHQHTGASAPIAFTGVYAFESHDLTSSGNRNQKFEDIFPIASSNHSSCGSCPKAKPQKCNSGDCVAKCGSGRTFDAAACACVCPPDTTVECNGRCVKTCPSGQVLNPNTCRCAVPQSPKITKGPQALIVTATGATITWSTDQDSDSAVDFGLTRDYDQSAARSECVFDHQITLTNLTPNTTYYFQVRSANDAGPAKPKTGKFRTKRLTCASGQLPCGSTCCAAPANATAACNNGVCDYACKAGFADCDGDPANGCETPLGTMSDCLACGDTCFDTNDCTSDACNPTTGCRHTPEPDGTPCLSGMCVSGMCQASCVGGGSCAGHADCCATGQVCVAGTCQDGTIDLEVLGIEPIVSPICAGSTPTLRATIRNNGSAPSGSVNIEWIADGMSFSGGHNSISAGATDTHDHIWGTPGGGRAPIDPGSHTITFIADYGDGIPETDESNNQFTLDFEAVDCSAGAEAPADTSEPEPTPTPEPVP